MNIRIQLLLICLLISTYTFSQQPDYNVSIKNEKLVDSRELQFDVYIKSIGNNTFEYASFQAGINVSTRFINGGTITVDTLAGNSDFNISKQSPVINKPSSSWDATNKRIKIIAQQPPGAGNGKIVSQTGDGDKLARFRIINSVDFDTTLPNLSFNFGTAISWTTKLFAYINGVSTEITDQNKILNSENSIILQEPINTSNSLKISDVQTNGIQLNINERNNAQNVLILINNKQTPSYVPIDGEEFNANQSFSNAQILTDSSRIIYDGVANNSGIDIAGLNEKTNYYFTAFLYNGSGTARNYLITSTITIDTITKTSTINNPIVTGFMPNIGNINDSFQIKGTKLYPLDSVHFGKTKLNIINHYGDSILVTSVPSGELSNLVKVYTSYGNASSPSYFTILPSISTVNNEPANIGDNIEINGFNFEGIDSVKIGILSQEIIETTTNKLTFKLSYYNQDEIVNIFCKNGQINTKYKIRFKPSIINITPRLGTTKDIITIQGKNLYNIDSVMVGNIKATIKNSYPDTSIEINIPPMAITSKITVFAKNGSVTSNDSLNIVSGFENFSMNNNIKSYFNSNNDLVIYTLQNNNQIIGINIYDITGQKLFETSMNEMKSNEITIKNQFIENSKLFMVLVKTDLGNTLFKKIMQ